MKKFIYFSARKKFKIEEEFNLWLKTNQNIKILFLSDIKFVEQIYYLSALYETVPDNIKQNIIDNKTFSFDLIGADPFTISKTPSWSLEGTEGFFIEFNDSKLGLTGGILSNKSAKKLALHILNALDKDN